MSDVDPQLPPDFRPEESWRGNRNDNQSSVTINNLGKTSIILLATFCGLALGLSVAAVILMVVESGHARDRQQAAQVAYQNQQALMHDEYVHQLEHYREDYTRMERQFRMTELKLDDWTVVAHRAGLQLPGDYTRGPQGNLDAESFHLQEKDHGSRRDNPPAGKGTGSGGQ